MSRLSRCPDFPGHFIRKVPFVNSTKYLDYAGVHIFKCPHKQVSLYNLKSLLFAPSCQLSNLSALLEDIINT